MRATMRLIAATAALAALTACGSDGGSSSSASREDPLTVRVGVIPAVDVAPLYLGIEKGFFLDEGLDVKPELATGGAATIPAVLSGDYDLALSASVPLILAKDQGLPLKIVSPANAAIADPELAFEGLVVDGDGPIQSLEDLAGQSIAVNAVKGISELSTRAILEDAGVDASSVSFSELPIPDMAAAVTTNRIPAVVMSEPFLSVALQNGARLLTPVFGAVEDKLTVATYFTSEEKIAQDPELVEKFNRAMAKSLDYAAEHPDEAREIVGTYTEIPPELLAAIKLPLWTSDLNRDSLQTMADLALEFGFVADEFNVDDLIWSGAEDQ